jgi:hypothetical protein
MSVGDPQTFNRYTYVDNDPVNQTDPSGLMTGPEYGWSAVEGGFWGSSIPFNQPHFGGPEAIASAQASFDTRLKNTLDAIAANEAYARGAEDLGDAIMKSNSTLEKVEQPAQTTQDPPAQGDVNVTITVLDESYAQIPNSGDGFYSSGRRTVSYGNKEVLASLIKFAADWNQKHPGFEIAFGEMSDRNGNTVAPHKSHKLGLRIDIRPMRNDGKHAPTNFRDPSYNQALTIELIKGLRALPHVKNILFNDPVTRQMGLTIYKKGHDNHLHVNFTKGW